MGRFHNDICAAYELLCVYTKELSGMVCGNEGASVLFLYHKEPQNVLHHKHMKWLPSVGKVHKGPYDMEKGICGSYSEASYHKPLNRVDSPHRSSDAYKHGAHNHVLSNTFFHMPNLDSRESVSLRIHTDMIL